MMKTTTNLINDTVIELFHQLETQKLNYAVMRNYERFPDFGHDVDLVIETKDIQKWREITIATAKFMEWDYLVECRHQGQSKVKSHNIEAYHFYNIDPLAHMFVDLFHGVSMFGITVFDELSLLSDAVYHPVYPIKRINPIKESFIRVTQIQKLYHVNPKDQKINRYHERISAFCQESENFRQLAQMIQDILPLSGERCMDRLLQGDMLAFSRQVGLAKQKFLLKHILREPLKTVFNINARLQSCYDFYFMHPCGITVTVDKAEPETLKNLQAALTILKNNNVINAWQDTWRESPGLRLAERRVHERGGIVVKFTSTNIRNAIYIPSGQTIEGIIEQLITILKDNHQVLYQR